MRDCVKVAFQIRIHDPVFPLLSNSVTRLSASLHPFPPEPVALFANSRSKIGSMHLQHCSLYHPVSYRRDPERSLLLAPGLGIHTRLTACGWY